MGKPSKQRVASTAPKVVADAWYYTMLVLNRTSPLITFCLSQYGYLDWLYKYTLGVPSQDKRLMYSLLLMVLTVNLVAGSIVNSLFQEPKPVTPAQPTASSKAAGGGASQSPAPPQAKDEPKKTR